MMKKCILIGLGLLYVWCVSKADGEISTKISLRDSVFNMYHSLPHDISYTDAVHDIFINYIDKPWITELLDSALVYTVRKGDTRGELKVLYDYTQFHEHANDVSGVESYLDRLKETGKRAKDYSPYFRALRMALQYKIALGDIEAVLLEAVNMEKEAAGLKCPEGKIMAGMLKAQALSFGHKYEESIKEYEKLLASSDISDADKAEIHGGLSLNYQYISKYEQSIDEMKKMHALLDRVICKDHRLAVEYRGRLFKLELRFCSIYLIISDKDNLLLHLKEAGKLQPERAITQHKISYYAYWAAYYYMIEQWDKCFSEFDRAIACFDGTEPMLELGVYHLRAQATFASGNSLKAAGLYRENVLKTDSLNQHILRLHEEAYQANYRIRSALLDKEKNEKLNNWLVLGSIFLLTVFLFGAILRALYVRRILRNSENETRKAWLTVDAANKMKESFLRNITYQIRLPLNSVVGLSEVLSTEKDLTPEQIEECSVVIKKSSAELIQMVTDILDLSRLESGMMRFKIQECEVVQLCKEAKMMVEMQEGNQVSLTFDTKLELLNIQADSSRFMKLLSFVLSNPIDETPYRVTYTLTCSEVAALIVVTGSPLLAGSNDEQEEHIRHKINRLYLQTFGGTYEIEKDRIVISYPLKMVLPENIYLID